MRITFGSTGVQLTPENDIVAQVNSNANLTTRERIEFRVPRPKDCSKAAIGAPHPFRTRCRQPSGRIAGRPTQILPKATFQISLGMSWQYLIYTCDPSKAVLGYLQRPAGSSGQEI